jgi:hypothetical protein
MSIIFQLFSAEDLQKLDVEELNKLKAEILAALRAASVLKEGEGKLHLNLREKVGPDEETPPELKPQPKWVEEALLKRFYEVSHQLKTPPRDPSQLSFNFQDLIDKRNHADIQKQEEMILKWAISCELNHIEFYYALVVARKGVDNFYKNNPAAKRKLLTEEQRKKDPTLEKVRGKDPDSGYSPFNPRHPLYRQFYDASGHGPEMTAQTSPSSS